VGYPKGPFGGTSRRDVDSITSASCFTLGVPRRIRLGLEKLNE